MKETDSRFCKADDEKCECGRQGLQILRCVKPFSVERMGEIVRGVQVRASQIEKGQ